MLTALTEDTAWNDLVFVPWWIISDKIRSHEQKNIVADPFRGAIFAIVGPGARN